MAWYARSRPGAGGLEREARLPRGRGLRLEDERLARRPGDRGPPGRLHAVRARADAAREARRGTNGSCCASTTRPHPFKLEGKQGYGKARGLWQTAYLEARPAVYVDSFEFHPDVGLKQVEARVRLSDPAPAGAVLALQARTPDTSGPALAEARQALTAGAREARLTLPLGESPRLWSLGRPLPLRRHPVADRGGGRGSGAGPTSGCDRSASARCRGSGIPYVALNGKPVYLQMTLDQCWHPEGFYTWPSDAAMREEILIARRLGLNAIRTHVKVELPRKLYWADRLGVLVMSDVPNSWGEPDAAMRRGVGDGLARHGAPRLQPSRDLLVGAVQRAVGAPVEGPAAPDREDGPAGDAGVGRLAGRAGEAARPDAPRRGQLALLRRGPREDRPQLWHMYLPGWKWRAQLDEAEAQDLPGLELELRRRPPAGRAARCSTASAATSGATRAPPATWTGASTTTP